MHVILSIGGSSIIPDGKPDLHYLKKLAALIKNSKNNFGILCGGGTIARLYANAARDLGASEYEADSIAIRSTRQNAHLLITALRSSGVEVHGNVIDEFEAAKEPAGEKKVVVMGGTIPGITTDTDSVLLAEAIGGKRLVNVSNVDAIYDSDPRKNPGAKRFDRMTYDQLIRLASESDRRMAGTNFVFDMLACKLIARSGIETHFVSYKKMDDLGNAIEGKRHGGTVVSAS